MPFTSLDDFINTKKSGFTGLDYFINQRKPFFSLDEFTAERMGLDYKKYKDLSRFKQEENDHRNAWDVIEQFARGVGKEATFGFGPKLWGTEEPVGTAEKIARGAGSFVGFLAPLLLTGGATGAIGKGLGLTTKAIKGGQYAKELAVLGRIGKTSVDLGIASAISDVPSAIENPAEALTRAKEGATLGAIFGGAGLVHIAEHKALSQVLRQVGGRAVMLATGKYDPKSMTKENLAEMVFSEALNTFFLSHGVTPKMILEGKFHTPSQKAMYEMLDADTVHLNEHTVALSNLKVPASGFKKAPIAELLINDILPSTDIGKLSRDNIESFKGLLKRGSVKRKPLRVQWNKKEGKYEAIDIDNEYLIALRERIVEAAANNGKAPEVIRARLLVPKPGTAPKMPRPIEMAMRFTSPRVVDQKLLDTLNSTRYWRYNIDTRRLRPTPPSQQNYEGKMKLAPREVLLERSQFDKANARWSFIPKAKGSKVPSFEWDARKVFSRHVDDQLYRDLEGQIDAMERQYPGLKDNDISGIPLADQQGVLYSYENAKLNLYNMYKRNVQLEEPVNKQIMHDMESGKLNKKWQGIDSVVDDATKKLKIIYNIPEQLLPANYVDMMDTRARNLHSTINIDVLKKALEIEGPWKVKHLSFLEEQLINLEKLPIEDRVSYLFTPMMDSAGLGHKEMVGEIADKQAAVESLERARRRDTVIKAEYSARHDPSAGSAMRQLLSTARIPLWRDRGKFFNYIQNKTGIPIFDIGEKLFHSKGEKLDFIRDISKYLERFEGMLPEEQAGVFLYYRRLYGLESVRDIPLNERQLDYISSINKSMESIAPLIIEERHKMWLDTVYDKEMEITGKPVKPSAKAFPRQDEAGIKAFLYEGAEAWKKWKITQDRTPYEQWIREAIDREIGTIAGGSYMPEYIVRMGKDLIDYDYEASNIGYTGKGHFKSRDIIKDNLSQVDLVKSLAGDFRDKNLHVRLYAYYNQVANVKYIEPYLDLLEKVVNVYPEEFKNAKPSGFGRKGIEAKTMSLLDYLRLYAHRIKGYPVKVGPIGEGLRAIQSIFFRSLTVRPFLITRNLPQRIITAPHKANVLDPRYLFKRQYKFDALPEPVKNVFHSTISQLRIFRQDYLQLMETDKLKNIPFVGPFIRFAERVGSLYALSDESNRRYTFSKSFFRGKDYINDYMNNKISMDTMERKLGILKMESNQQRLFREAIHSKDVDAAALKLAEWTDINTNWLYNRTEKSLPEMTGEGESWTNLLTWAKGITQWMADGVIGSKDGLEMMYRFKPGTSEFKIGYQKAIDGAGKMIGLALCGGIANTLLNTISLRKASKFQSYGVDMFMWDLGGVSLDIVKQFSDTMGSLITSVDGTKEERAKALEDAMKMLDNTMIRQLVPFAKNALSTVESFTGRSYISPFYDKWTEIASGYPRGKTYVQRTMLEGFAHAVFASDPNKSEQVRKWTFEKMHELSILSTKPGIMKPYYESMYQIYKYYNDMMMRYKPYQLLKDREQADYIKKYNRAKQEQNYKDWLYRSKIEQYKAKGNY